MTRRRAAAAATAVALVLTAAAADAAAPSPADLDSVLARHLRAGRVDYAGLAADRAALDRYLTMVASADPDRWPRAEQIAFWVNAYNARVLDGVARRPGLRSVLDVGRILGIPTLAFFRERRQTGGRVLTLDDIEHGILRKRFRDPRVHFVLNCASASCPVLPERALTGATLEADLDRATRRFLADRQRNRIDPERELALSAIFRWFRDDFRAAGGVQAFIEAHWAGEERFTPDLPIRHLRYDWSLNGHW